MTDFSKLPVTILSDAEAVRGRTGMYLGEVSITSFLGQIVSEFCNEAQAGFCDEIIIRKNGPFRYSISDNGRPFNLLQQPGSNSSCSGVSSVETRQELPLLRQGEEDPSKITKLSIAIYLSKHLDIVVKQGKETWKQNYDDGKHLPAERCNHNISPFTNRITFELDPCYLIDDTQTANRLIGLLRPLAATRAGLHLCLFFDRLYSFNYPEGLLDYVREYAAFEWWQQNGLILIKCESEFIKIEVAIQWLREGKITCHNFLNGTPSQPIGKHWEGLFRALVEWSIEDVSDNQEEAGLRDIISPCFIVFSLWVDDRAYLHDVRLANETYRLISTWLETNQQLLDHLELRSEPRQVREKMKIAMKNIKQP